MKITHIDTADIFEEFQQRFESSPEAAPVWQVGQHALTHIGGKWLPCVITKPPHKETGNYGVRFKHAGKTFNTVSSLEQLKPMTEGGIGGGSLGQGINQWNTNNPVSYEHVLDEVENTVLEQFAEWMAEQSINELSVDKMQAYKDKVSSPQTFRTRQLGKLPKGVEGKAAATRKINAKMGNRMAAPAQARATYEERLAEFTELDEAPFDPNEFSDILGKQHAEQQAAKKMPVKDIPFHNWTIRYRPASKPGEKVQWQVMDKKGDVKGRGEAMSDKEAVGAAEDYIKKGTDTRQQATDKVTIDFNVNFTKEFGDEFFANIIADNSGPALLIAYQQEPGMKRSYARNQKEKMTATTTKLTCIPMSAKEANDAGLQPNGRYILGDKQDMGEYAMFPLIYQSTVQGKGDMMKMGKPGLTVAHNRDVAEDCWDGYKQLGMKDKDGKQVPNCVPTEEEIEEAYEGPWHGDPVKNAKSPKSSMQGAGDVRLSDMIKDTIDTHGVKWAFEYYVKKHGMPPRHFQILSGLTAKPAAKKPEQKPSAQVLPFPQKKPAPAQQPDKKGWWASMMDKLAAE
jgi:hypothetical protein